MRGGRLDRQNFPGKLEFGRLAARLIERVLIGWMEEVTALLGAFFKSMQNISTRGAKRMDGVLRSRAKRRVGTFICKHERRVRRSCAGQSARDSGVQTKDGGLSRSP